MHACACARVCVRACVRACVRVRVCACRQVRDRTLELAQTKQLRAFKVGTGPMSIELSHIVNQVVTNCQSSRHPMSIESSHKVRAI